MEKTGEFFFKAGMVIFIIAACCVDSVGKYGTMAVIAAMLGLVVAGAGYGVKMAAGDGEE